MFCTDFRGLNSVTVTDAHPLPRVDTAIDQLSGSTFFSCLDLSSGYWQVEFDPQDREKTAFSIGRGLWQYKVMAMGLKNARPTFQRLMELVLSGLAACSCVYWWYLSLSTLSRIIWHCYARSSPKLESQTWNWSLVNVNFFKQVWYSWEMKCRQVRWDLIQLTLRSVEDNQEREWPARTNKVEWPWEVVLPKTMRENTIYSLHDKSGLFCHT